MKNTVLLRVRTAMLMGVILLPSLSYGDAVWPAIVSVTDEDLVILRSTRMPRGDTVLTENIDEMDVSLSQDVTICANDCGPSRLLLVPTADEGGLREIIFFVNDYNLTFKMHSKEDEFSIEKINAGDVIFIMNNGHELEFKPSSHVRPIVFPLPGTVRWHGNHVFDILDQDVVWDGHMRLPGGLTTITASTVDVNIFISKEAKFRNSKNTDSTLRINALIGRTVTIYLDRELEFESDNGYELIFELGGNGLVRIVRQP